MSQTLAFLDQPGKSAELIKSFEWSSTALGEPQSWPQSLKTAVGIVLGAGQACNLLWGPDLITFYNDAYRHLLGKHVRDGIGIPYPSFRPDIWPFAKEHVMRAFAGRAVTVVNARTITHRHGKVEEAYFTMTSSPVFDETSSVAGVLNYMFENTRAILAQQALEGENSLLRRGLNHLPQMVWSTLPDGYHDFYNDQWYAFTGVERGSTDGEGWNDMFHPGDQDRAWSIWRNSLRTGEPYEIKYRLKHRDGGYRWTLGRALPERDEAGKIIRWYGTCTDIHEHILAENQVQSLQSELIHMSRLTAMGSMAATLAHEVNQPLTAAANFASGLRRQLERGASSDDLLAGVTGVEGAVLRAGDIIRRLRQMVQGNEPQKECVLASELVRDACALLETICSKVNMSWAIEEDAQLMCDPVQIQQVLVNLIKNACEALVGQKEPCISVTVKAQDKSVRFCVADNGPGIPPGGEATIFDALVSCKVGGMGIGLAISRTIVEAHSGSIRVEPLQPHGALFCFDLPSSGDD